MSRGRQRERFVVGGGWKNIQPRNKEKSGNGGLIGKKPGGLGKSPFWGKKSSLVVGRIQKWGASCRVGRWKKTLKKKTPKKGEEKRASWSTIFTVVWGCSAE